MTFSASIFASIFHGKLPLKWSGESSVRRPFFHLFRDLVIYVDFMLNLAHFWLPFGALWLTLGSLWLTFGSLLVPFGSLLVPWAHFWRSWRSIFSFLVSPSVIFHISFYNMDGVPLPKREAQFFSLFVPPDIIFPTSFYNMDGVPLPKPACRHLHA